MNRRCIFTLGSLLVLSVSAFSQFCASNTPDTALLLSSKSEVWKEKWQISEKTNFAYDPCNRVIETDWGGNSDDEEENWESVYTYNQSGADNIRIDLSYDNTKKQWLKSRRVITNDHKIDDTITTQYLEKNSWVNFAREIRHYSPSGLLLDKTTFNWITKWIPVKHFRYEFSCTGKLVLFIQEEWSNTASSWVGERREQHLFNKSDQETETIYQNFNGSSWVNASRRLNQYTSGNRTSVESVFFWDSLTFSYMGLERYLYFYREEPRRLTTEKVQQDWINKSWRNLRKETTVTNDKKQELSYLDCFWKTDQWDSVDQKIYDYDPMGNLLSVTTQGWSGDKWVNIKRKSNEYRYVMNFSDNCTSMIALQESTPKCVLTDNSLSISGFYRKGFTAEFFDIRGRLLESQKTEELENTVTFQINTKGSFIVRIKDYKGKQLWRRDVVMVGKKAEGKK